MTLQVNVRDANKAFTHVFRTIKCNGGSIKGNLVIGEFGVSRATGYYRIIGKNEFAVTITRKGCIGERIVVCATKKQIGGNYGRSKTGH